MHLSYHLFHFWKHSSKDVCVIAFKSVVAFVRMSSTAWNLLPLKVLLIVGERKKAERGEFRWLGGGCFLDNRQTDGGEIDSPTCQHPLPKQDCHIGGVVHWGRMTSFGTLGCFPPPPKLNQMKHEGDRWSQYFIGASHAECVLEEKQQLVLSCQSASESNCPSGSTEPF
jgi:hypothetical protein